jgi:hypothetical protein
MTWNGYKRLEIIGVELWCADIAGGDVSDGRATRESDEHCPAYPCYQALLSVAESA